MRTTPPLPDERGGGISTTRSAQVAPLAGRDREAHLLAGLLSRAERQPAGLLLRGEAGIGKTALWRQAVAAARDRGWTSLVSRPSAEERDVALNALADLCGATVPLEAGTSSPFTHGRALLDGLRRLTVHGPVVLAVDDTPCLDEVSAAALRYALRRLVDEPVLVVATARSGGDQRDALDLATTLAGHVVRTVDLAPLDADDLREALADHVGRLPRPVLRRLHELSGGNPFHAIELARCLRDTRDEGQVLALPRSVREVLDQRLAALGPDLRAVVEVLAVAGPQRHGLLAEVLRCDVDAAVEDGCARDLLLVDEHSRLRFAHPLVAAATAARTPPGLQRALHARLAGVLAASAPEESARHLALSTPLPDAMVAQQTSAAAERAYARGGAYAAVALFEEAWRLTPETEPALRRNRLLRVVEVIAGTGDVGRASTLVDRLVDTLPAGPERADALLARFSVDREAYPQGALLLEQALGHLGADRARRARVLGQLGWVRGMFCGDLAAGMRSGRAAVDLLRDSPDRAAHVLAEARLTHMRTLSGRGTSAAMAALVERAGVPGAPQVGPCPQAWLSKQLLWDGDLEDSRRLVLRLLADGARTGNELERPYRLYDLALAELTAGRVEQAGLALRAGLTAAADAGNRDAEGWLDYPLAWHHALAGRTEEAVTCAVRLRDRRSRPGGVPAQARAHRVLGLVALGTGDCATASSELDRALTLLDQWGVGHPGAVPVLPDAVEASASTGDLARARSLLARLERQTLGSGGRWAGVMLRRSRAVLALAEGRPEPAADQLGAVAAELTSLGHLVDAARARALAGNALLRVGKRTEARSSLDAAHRSLGQLGARLWQDRTAQDLARVPAERTMGSLTATERRIVGLVTQGRRNREIAAELFLGVATVEAHLTRVYRKLGIRSRTELVALAGREALVELPAALRPTDRRIA